MSRLSDLTMIRFIIAAASLKTGARYTAIFFQLGGMYGSYNVILAWVSSTFPRPRAKRAVALAVVNAAGNGEF